MHVKKYINSIFSSNSYLLNIEEDKGVWIIDPGDTSHIIEWLNNNDKFLKGIIITHSHFDHIYGINDLSEKFPSMEIFASQNAKEGMLSAKLNRSYYTENPFVVNSRNINIVVDHDQIPLSENIYANVIYTPGHNNDCLSFDINEYLFTGDALIPDIKVYTKSKNGDKSKAKESINKIFNLFSISKLVCPGHGNICRLGEIKTFYLHNSLFT